MSELTGAKLALAVAQVMGLVATPHDGHRKPSCYLVENLPDHHGDYYPCVTTEFRPDLGGEAGAQALDRLIRMRGGDVPEALTLVETMIYKHDCGVWIAICCAVIAAGGDTR